MYSITPNYTGCKNPAYCLGCASVVSGTLCCQAPIKTVSQAAVWAGLLHHCPTAVVSLLLQHDLLFHIHRDASYRRGILTVVLQQYFFFPSCFFFFFLHFAFCKSNMSWPGWNMINVAGCLTLELLTVRPMIVDESY